MARIRTLYTLPRSWSTCLWQNLFLLMVTSGRAWKIDIYWIRSISKMAFSKNWFGESGGKWERKWLFLIFDIMIRFPYKRVKYLVALWLVGPQTKKALKAWNKQTLSQRYHIFDYVTLFWKHEQYQKTVQRMRLVPPSN